MILETKRLILRPFEESDAESVYEYAKDPNVGPIAGWPVHTSVENSREIIMTVLSARETYAVCLKEDKRAIGSIGLMIGKQSNLDLPENEGEIGYWIGVPFWGNGLIPEAMREIVRHAFTDLRIKTLWCGYFDGNEKSKKAQEKCGFLFHHTNRDILWEMTGDIRTEHITRLTKEEWTDSFIFRRLYGCEINAAHSLAREVFLKYVSPDYSAEGTGEFISCLCNEKYLEGIEYFGAFDRDRLIGMTGIRQDKCHICFCFVDGYYHRLGVGRKMLDLVKKEYEGRSITLNSSPFALPFYKSIGFSPTCSEQTVNGIRFTPMTFECQAEECITGPTPLQQRLLEMRDEKYAAFQSRLIPGVEPELIIGIKVPVLREFAKKYCKEPSCKCFIHDLPHKYYDENMLHGLIISEMADYNAIISNLDEFLPFVNNWAVCDIISPKSLKKHTTEFINKIEEWIQSPHPYTCRFGMKMLMSFYLDGDFDPEYLKLPASVHSDEYYVNMMIAWFFATALAKQWNSAVPYIENGILDTWTHNKTIQKAVESYRITDQQKEYLKKLKRRSADGNSILKGK